MIDREHIPQREPDLVLAQVISFWWKERVQIYGDFLYFFDPDNWTWRDTPYNHTYVDPNHSFKWHSYSGLEWFKTYEEKIKSSYTRFLLDQTIEEKLRE